MIIETLKEKQEREEKERLELVKTMTRNIMNNYKASPKVVFDKTYELKKIEK